MEFCEIQGEFLASVSRQRKRSPMGGLSFLLRFKGPWLSISDHGACFSIFGLKAHNLYFKVEFYGNNSVFGESLCVCLIHQTGILVKRSYRNLRRGGVGPLLAPLHNFYGIITTSLLRTCLKCTKLRLPGCVDLIIDNARFRRCGAMPVSYRIV